MFEQISTGRWWDKPWGLVSSCTRCSPGCRGCWSLRNEARFHRGVEGKIEIHPERLDIPLRRKKPTAFAVWNDLFHEDVPNVFIRNAFESMRMRRHIFLVLTKRIKRMREILGWYPDWHNFEWPNVWLGVTVCNQQEADEKIPILLQIPAAVRYLSIEPMLGTISLQRIVTVKENAPYPELSINPLYGKSKLDWVILGGETGPGARPMKTEWVRDVRDQCLAANIPFYFKGWGPRKEVGRILDGREWNELPKFERAK